MIVPARLDGSNFTSLTGTTGVAELSSATVFGPTAMGLRSAARVESAALFSQRPSDRLDRFQHNSAVLPADRFAMAATTTLPQD
jgi:hypothetical protein